MKILRYQLIRMTLETGERWCILSDAGGGWFKMVQDFPVDMGSQAQAALDIILMDRNRVGDVAASRPSLSPHLV